jgi:hypothetical protein
MQDSNTPRAYRMHDERVCLDCPVSFVPTGNKQTRCPDCQAAESARLAREAKGRALAKRKIARVEARLAGPGCSICRAPLRKNNTIGRCQEHRYIGEGMGACGHCGAPLRRDNKIGYCEKHKFATSRAPVRFCAEKTCDRQLRIDNESGYCAGHVSLTENSRLYREALYASLRLEGQARREARSPCSITDCTNKIRSDNTTGRCREHVYVPVEMPECSYGGCGNRLLANNLTGRCGEHRAKYWVASECAADDCEKTINADCVTGYCREHRRLSDWRKEYDRNYYQSRKAEFQEYARLWRLANGDDHRAAVRAWNAANREARQAMHARRRVRVDAGMTMEDRRQSVARRKAIKADPCFYCDSPVTHHVDHFYPLAKGGTDHWWCLVRSCERCNLTKMTRCGTAFMLLSGNWRALPSPASLTPEQWP